MSNVPTNLIPSTITQLPEYDGSSTLGYLPYSLGGRTYKVQFSNIAAVGAVPSTRTIATGNGLQGGGDLSQNRTISIIPHGVGYDQLDFTGIVAGTYGSADTVPTIGVDATGRINYIANTPIVLSNYVPSSRTVSAGAGLTGGGQLNGNITISLNPSNATPQPLGVASAGTGTQAARDDHVHPAVDLTDTSETQGVLPLGRGGTGVDLSPVLGAVIYADNDSLNQTTAGNVGQVLTSAGGLGAPYWQTITGTGTVTSINVSGGSTGLTTSGGPITTTGTITIGGTLAPTSGGTGITSYAVGDLLFANTTTSLDKLHVGSNGYLLASNGTAPQYTNPTGVTVGTATNLAGGAGGSIPYQSSAGTTTFLASGTGVLTASGGNPSYTMTPSLTQVTVAGDPTTNLQVATKQYVDTIATTSVHYHTPVKYEVPDTTGNLNATYNNGTAGVGATLTNAGTLGAFTPDGIVASVNDRILIYNQTNAYENGVYTVTTVGNGSTPWVLTRATDADTYDPISPNSLGGGDAFFVTSGNTGAGETYVCNNVGTITFGTTAITFVQVSATQVYSAGTGLTLTGTTFSLTAPVATSLGGTGLTSFTSGGAVYATSTSALTTGTLPITAGGTGQTTASAAFNALSPITTTGDLIIGNGTNSATRLPIGANGYILTSNGTTASWGPAPSSMVYPGAGIAVSTGSAWGTSFDNSANPISVAYGGTGATSLTSGYLVKGNGTSAVSASVVYDNGTNVGIGTSSPQGLFHVVAGTNNSLLLRGPVTYATGGSIYAVNAANTVIAPMEFGASAFYFAGGNVGVGTASAGYPLTVQANSSTQALRLVGRSADSISTLEFADSAQTVTQGYIQSSGNNILFATGTTERLRIGPAGQIGLSGANYGTSGQILTSNGSGSAPTWQNAPATGVTQARATAISMILGF